jgi:hypothetical protein
MQRILCAELCELGKVLEPIGSLMRAFAIYHIFCITFGACSRPNTFEHEGFFPEAQTTDAVKGAVGPGFYITDMAVIIGAADIGVFQEFFESFAGTPITEHSIRLEDENMLSIDLGPEFLRKHEPIIVRGAQIFDTERL